MAADMCQQHHMLSDARGGQQATKLDSTALLRRFPVHAEITNDNDMSSHCHVAVNQSSEFLQGLGLPVLKVGGIPQGR